MKTTLPLLFMLMLATALKVNAQTSLTMDSCYIDSSLAQDVYSCPGQYHSIRTNVYTAGYSSGDTIHFTIHWGGGITDTVWRLVYSNQPTYQLWFVHYYNNLPNGSYTPQIIAVAPDGKRDTSYSRNSLHITTCGNLSGNIYFDDNNNCIRNTGEYSGRWQRVELQNTVNASTYSVWADSAGDYSAQVPLGTYHVKLASTLFPTFCPVGGHTSVTTGTSGLDFGIQCSNTFDLTGYVWGAGFRPGFSRTFSARVFNLQCLPIGGELKIILSDPRISYVPTSNYPAPTRVSGDTIVYSFSNLRSWHRFNYYNYIGAKYFRIYTDTTATLNDTICIDMEVIPIAGDVDTTNNRKRYCFPVRNSFDPNDKQGFPLGIGPDNVIGRGQDIDYTIRFQNTGNAPAVNVYLLDTLPEEMDLNSLTINGASHPFKMYVDEDRRVRFYFNNINLPDSNSNEPESHGFVNFSLAQKPNLPYGTYVENTAYIYFDFNEAIITNTTSHKIDLIDAIGEYTGKARTDFELFPNPTQNEVWIERAKDGEASVRVYSILGELKMTKVIHIQREKIQVGQLKTGIYFVEIDDGDRQIKRLVIE